MQYGVEGIVWDLVTLITRKMLDKIRLHSQDELDTTNSMLRVH